MGKEEGLTEAVGQIDAILAEDTRSRLQETDDDCDCHRADHPRRSRCPGATLTYDVRPNDQTTEPPLFLIGSPMGAGGFVTLASALPGPHDRHLRPAWQRAQHRARSGLADHARGPGRRRPRDHPGARRRPVDLFASSGGAVVALALVAKYPNDLRIAVAHEPPLASLVPDREQALAANRAIHDTYMANGFGAGMAKFMQVVDAPGPVHGRGGRGARAGPRDVRHVGRGRRQPQRPDARPQRRRG